MTKRVAVLIANGKFSDPGLPHLSGYAKDCQQLAEILSDPELGGFDEVTALVDDGFVTVRKAIARACASLGVEDTMLLYYSGASFRDRRGNLWLPVVDTEAEFYTATCLEPDFILSQLRESRCRKLALIIDGCHSGAFFHNNRGIPDGLIAITACSDVEVCYETEEGGIFTRALVEGLRGGKADEDGDSKVSVNDLYAFTCEYIAQSFSEEFSFHPQRWVWNLPEEIVLVIVPMPVFISYAREDSDLVQALSQELERNGVKTWVDTQAITGGEDWLERIALTVESAKALVLILSELSLDSKWVRRELEFADQKGVPIIPVAYTPCDLPSWFEIQFGRLQRVAIDKDCLAESVPELVKAIRAAHRIEEVE